MRATAPRRRARSCARLAPLVALACLVVPSPAPAYVPNETLTAAAEEPVWCWSDAEWEPYRSRALAFYAPESGSVPQGVHMPWRRCARLVRAADGWRPEPGVARRRLAMTLFTLAHEVGHALAPDGTELDADCIAASWTFWRVGKRLGIEWPYRLALARVAARGISDPCWPRRV